MPRATLVQTDLEPIFLKSLEGGYVKLRRLPYGKWLARQEAAMNIRFEGSNKKKGMSGEIDMLQRATALMEFDQCIVEHNLTDENDQPLNFKSMATLDALDPRIGTEIGKLIAEMHEFDEGN